MRAGTHTDAENKLHQGICKAYGAIDVTDLSDIKLGSNTSDAVICLSPNPISLLSGASSINPMNGFSLTVQAPNGTVSGPYWIRGGASYTNAIPGYGLAMSVGVNADRCSATGGAAIPVATGTSYIQATCSYPSSKGPRQSYMQAQLMGQNSTGYGTITVQ